MFWFAGEVKRGKNVFPNFKGRKLTKFTDAKQLLWAYDDVDYRIFKSIEKLLLPNIRGILDKLSVSLHLCNSSKHTLSPE